MKNLHLKNLKNNNIEQIKQTSWFKNFDEAQQYYIEKGLESGVDINKFAKKEIKADRMFSMLRVLEKRKYGKVLTKPRSAKFKIDPPRKLQIQKTINELDDQQIQEIFDELDDEEIQNIINKLNIDESN